MKGLYYTFAGAAIVFAGALLGLQIMGGLEYTAGASAYTVASMVGAMITVAILPVFIHLSGHLSRSLQVVLFFGFAAFLVYSLPATVGRVGEVKETKALAKVDAELIRADLAHARQTLAYAIPDRDQECRIVGPECRRKRVTVQALEGQIATHTAALVSLGNARIGDVGSELLSWATGGKIAAESIRKGSGLGLPFGLEIAIWALVWLATVAIQHGMSLGPVVHAPAVQAITEREEPLTSDELEELRRILLSVRRPVNNNELADLVGISPGECSKRVKDAVAAGILQKQRAGREVAITLH